MKDMMLEMRQRMDRLDHGGPGSPLRGSKAALTPKSSPKGGGSSKKVAPAAFTALDV